MEWKAFYVFIVILQWKICEIMIAAIRNQKIHFINVNLIFNGPPNMDLEVVVFLMSIQIVRPATK